MQGESKAEGMKDKIQLESWSWGETNQGTAHVGGGSGAGRVHMQDIHFTSRCSKASAKLLLACATGEHFEKDVVLTCRKAGGKQEPYLVVKLKGAFISSYHIGGSAHADILPMDQYTMNFGAIEVEYKEQTDKGTVGAPFKAG